MDSRLAKNLWMEKIIAEFLNRCLAKCNRVDKYKLGKSGSDSDTVSYGMARNHVTGSECLVQQV
jgi:hypothetical protein